MCLRIIRPPHIAPLITQLHFEYSISALCLSPMLLLIWTWQFRNIQVQILATIIFHIFASGAHQFELGNFQTNTNPSWIFVLACTWQWCISLMWLLLHWGGQLNAKSYHSREVQWFDPTKADTNYKVNKSSLHPSMCHIQNENINWVRGKTILTCHHVAGVVGGLGQFLLDNNSAGSLGGSNNTWDTLLAILTILVILAIIHRGLQVAVRSAGGATYVCRTPTINIRATLIWLFEPAQSARGFHIRK